MTIKVRTNHIFNAMADAGKAWDSAKMLYDAERVAPINVHSHGHAINAMINELESALRQAKAFKTEVQGR